jgi:uncharacterized protein
VSNHLIDETSPYLQQHAENPVDWHPWGEAALALARVQNKPILLSIGYSACHWCHVMEHESFEDEATAALMNERFINIKVDREERPDLDKIYQLSYQLLNQRAGGWPLNMFLHPDNHLPFFGGTYFPPQPRHKLPAFSEIVQRVSDFYTEHKEDIVTQNASLQAYLQRAEGHESGAQDDEQININALLLDESRRQLEKSYDAQYGGFGDTPKFPHPTNLERLLRHWSSTGGADQQALHMVRSTLQAMAAGGIYDHLGGGFCRYAVDEKWMIPHFEKMLYDNGPLLTLYSDAYAATADATFKRVVEESAEWVMMEMQAPNGGYYSSMDADSEGKEGTFYIWTLTQVQQLLDDTEYAVVSRHYGLDKTANFDGVWHLYVCRSLEDIGAELSQDITIVHSALASARQKLWAAREQRIKPGRDEKILSSWNGLMMKGMAQAGRCLGNPRYIASAEKALQFVRRNMWKNGRLLATSKDGRAHLMAYLDDYVFVAEAVLALLEARWNNDDLQLLIELLDALLTHFSAEGGGFYFTANDHEQLIQRPRPWMDDALPAGNAVAAQVLLRAGALLNEPRYLDAAESTLKAAWKDIQGFPQAHNGLLNAVETFLYGTELIVLRGDEEEMAQWNAELNRHYAPRRLLILLPSEEQNIPAALAHYRAPENGVCAYVCKGGQCLPAVYRLADIGG